MRTLVINSSNLVSNGTQLNHFQYKFPTQWRATAGAKVAVASVSLYNSTFNVDTSRGNNTITINFGQGDVVFTLPSGYYSIDQINDFLQQQFVLNNLYCTSATNNTQNVYFVQLQTNPTRYSAQLTVYQLSESNTYNPVTGFQFTGFCPVVTLSNGMASLLGLPPGQYPPANTDDGSQSSFSYVSADYGLAPNLNIVDSYTILCSLIQNPYSIPSNYLTQIPLNVGFGSLISVNNGSSLVWNDVRPDIYNTVDIYLADQFTNPLQNHDSSFTLTLAIDEGQGK